jgi:hypothetical protein
MANQNLRSDIGKILKCRPYLGCTAGRMLGITAHVAAVPVALHGLFPYTLEC